MCMSTKTTNINYCNNILVQTMNLEWNFIQLNCFYFFLHLEYYFKTIIVCTFKSQNITMYTVNMNFIQLSIYDRTYYKKVPVKIHNYYWSLQYHLIGKDDHTYPLYTQCIMNISYFFCLWNVNVKKTPCPLQLKKITIEYFNLFIDNR